MEPNIKMEVEQFRQMFKRKTTPLWPPRRASWLKTEAMRDFRKSYRNYRKGHWRGAKGELYHVILDEEEKNGFKGTLNGAVEEETSQQDGEQALKEASIFQEFEDPTAIRHLQQLEKYRRAYRKFRAGGDRGAQGEIVRLAAKFTKDQLRLLPIAALAQCLADQVHREDALEPSISKFHVHWGAGKLGLGLVLPAMVASETPFGICQRPSEAWEPVLKASHAHLDVFVNEEFLTSLTVIRSIEDLEKLEYVRRSENGTRKFIPPLRGSPEVEKARFLVFDSEVEDLMRCASESFSCALGPGLASTMKALCDVLPVNNRLDRPALYACENDHKAVDNLRPFLEQRMDVKECMVDRICSDRIIKPTSIHVTVEPYPGEIVVAARGSKFTRPAFFGSNVLFPRTTGGYSYLYNRKFLLVNGTHTTLAFMTLRRFCHEPADAPGDFELLSPESLTDAETRELHAWIVARCLVLLHNHEVDVIKYAHGVERDEEVVDNLWGYAQRILKRFATIKDTTKRVLGGGVVNRYETRLKDVVDTLETFNRSVPLASSLFSLTGFRSMNELIQTIQRLVSDAECFVTFARKPSSPSTAHDPNQPASLYVEGYHRQFRGRA